MYPAVICALLLNPAPRVDLFEIQTAPEDTLVITVTFMGYSLGDYVYAEFTDENGDLITASPPRDITPGLEIFLFQHRGELVEVTFVNLLSWIPEAGEGIFPMVLNARTEEETYEDWYLRVSEELGLSTTQELRAYYGNPETEEEYFDSNDYITQSGANYRAILQPEE